MKREAGAVREMGVDKGQGWDKGHKTKRNTQFKTIISFIQKINISLWVNIFQTPSSTEKKGCLLRKL